MLFAIANRKLLMGAKIKLETAMGSVKIKSERPLDNCSGVSLKMEIKVRSTSSIKEDNLLERLLTCKITRLIKAATPALITVNWFPDCFHFSGLRERKIKIITNAKRDKASNPRDKTLMI